MPRLDGLKWLLVTAGLAASANACGGTSAAKKDAEPSAGEASGATSSVGGGSAGDAPAAGGVGGAVEGQAGAPEPVAGSPSVAGAAGADPGPSCAAPTALSILGNYVEPNGSELWLRDSGKAVTVTRVPPGKPAAGNPPALWRVLQSCVADSVLLLQRGSGSFSRLDYLEGVGSLTACWSNGSASSVEQALALPAADRANTIDSGCNDGPWLRFSKEGQ